MFSIYIKDRRGMPNSICIYDDLTTEDEYQLIDPDLTTEDNVTGSLEFEVPLCNNGYSEITPYSSDMDVYVYKLGYENIYGQAGTDDVYWAGRIVTVEKGIENRKLVYCEGVLGFLNDTIQLPNKYTTNTDDNNASFSDPTKKSLHNYIEVLLDNHNAKVPDNRKIHLGETTAVYEPTDWFTNYETTLEVLEDIASATDGHLRVRRTVRNGGPAWALDLLNDDIWIEGQVDSNGDTMTQSNKWRYIWIPNNDQEIEYGVNLTDLDIKYDLSSIITKVYPLGKRKESSTQIEGLDEYWTIAGATDPAIAALPSWVSYHAADPNDPRFNVPYLLSSLGDPNDPKFIGVIESVVHYDDIENKPDELMKLGVLQLTAPDSIYYEVEASAIDAYYRDRSLKSIDTHDVIYAVSLPHGLSNYLKVSKSEIPLDQPSNTKYTIGSTAARTFTQLTAKNNKNIASEIKYLSVKPYWAPEDRE